MPYLLIGLLTAAGFIICAADKRAAVRHSRRVSERTLFLLAFFGGALGVWLAMLIFHHKTRKLKFAVLMPALAIVQAALAICPAIR